jgi:hypothetical protein
VKSTQQVPRRDGEAQAGSAIHRIPPRREGMCTRGTGL